MPSHIKKGDQVIVTAGNFRGSIGEVLFINLDKSRALVKGVNVRTKRLKATQQRPQASTMEKEMPIHLSNLSPVVDGKPSRVRFVIKADGSKVRIAARGGRELHKLHGARTTSK
ncbi:MAG: 50S ribosomal protein L24 [Phycisphaerales bacterium]|nr:50S ribosomal protein L24 [Phycisphaerales bacterium]